MRPALPLLASLVALAGCRAPLEEPASVVASDPASASREVRPPPDASALSGRLTTRYRGRKGHGDEDHDLSQTADLTYAAPDAGWKARVYGRVQWDVDGSRPDDPTFELANTRDGDLTGRLYHAYVDVTRFQALSTLRVGRQDLYETPVFLTFDGVLAEGTVGELGTVGAGRVRAGAYGGVPVHPWESSSRGDLVGGLYTELAPWRNARVRAEWMHVEDERRAFERDDDLLGLTVTQGIDGEHHATTLSSTFTALERSARDLRLGATHHDLERRIYVDVSWYELFETRTEEAVPLDPFYTTLFELYPYRLVGASVSRAWEHFDVDGGYARRAVVEDADVGELNRDYDRAFLSLASGALAPDTRVSVTGEQWNSAEDRIRTWGVDATHDAEGLPRFSVGSYFSLFKYDFESSVERDRIRTTYVDVRFSDDAATPFSARYAVRYEFEDSNIDDRHRLTLGVTWRF